MLKQNITSKCAIPLSGASTVILCKRSIMLSTWREKEKERQRCQSLKQDAKCESNFGTFGGQFHLFNDWHANTFENLPLPISFCIWPQFGNSALPFVIWNPIDIIPPCFPWNICNPSWTWFYIILHFCITWKEMYSIETPAATRRTIL